MSDLQQSDLERSPSTFYSPLTASFKQPWIDRSGISTISNLPAPNSLSDFSLNGTSFEVSMVVPLTLKPCFKSCQLIAEAMKPSLPVTRTVAFGESDEEEGMWIRLII